MSKPLPAIRSTVRQFLRDEFLEGVAQDFQDDEIDLHVGEVVAEVSERSPYVVKETLTTTDGSRELTISSIEDLLEIEKLEYPTGSDPRDYRNLIEIDAETIEIDTTLTPSADEDVYLYCRKLHQLTEESSTLTPQLERVLIDGTVAKVALSWINQVRVQVKEAVAVLAKVEAAIGSMSAPITKAITDLNTGRPLIAETRALADAAIDNMTARITQALTDLAAGRPKIGRINVAGRPQADLASYASRELDGAATFLGQARGYLSVDTPAGQYGTYAARELSNASGLLGQAGGHLRELSARLSISGVINSYQTWANNKLALYRVDLGRLSRARTYTEYPKS
ncbi:hypothetical protein ES707_14426 [subsurface metagenome]